MKAKDRAFAPYNLGGGMPRKIPEGKFLWHNHVMHCEGMLQGCNGFRYCAGWLPVDREAFERCHCGVVALLHYKIRGLGSGKCVPPEWVLPSLKDGVRVPPTFGKNRGRHDRNCS